ncbi:MAG: alpha-hydroxy acid oxidase [Chloroflexota bacterium]
MSIVVGPAPVATAEDFATIGELPLLAEQKLAREIWDYCAGGSASEATLRRNRRALERLALVQRVLVDVRQVNLSTSFLGLDLPLPVLVAPMGSLYRFCPEGDLQMAIGAGRAGALSTVSGVCGWPMEQMAAEGGGPLVFQLYYHGPREWVAERLRRVESCPQYRAVCLTVDSAVYSRRDRDHFNRYRASSRAAAGQTPEPSGPDHDVPASLTWDDVDWLKRQVHLPFGLKGINCVEDAALAIDHGCDFIWVSNHGGRQLDDGEATIDTLPRIADEVAGRLPIVVDGGFVRGTEVMKGLALGATMVAVGKIAACALAVGGAGAVERLLGLLREELRIGLALSGNTAVQALGPSQIRRTEA